MSWNFFSSFRQNAPVQQTTMTRKSMWTVKSNGQGSTITEHTEEITENGKKRRKPDSSGTAESSLPLCAETDSFRRNGQQAQNKTDRECCQPSLNAQRHHIMPSPDTDLISGRQESEETPSPETQNKTDRQCCQSGPKPPDVTMSPDGEVASGSQKFEETLRMQRDTQYTTRNPETADAMIKTDVESEKKQMDIMNCILNVLAMGSGKNQGTQNRSITTQPSPSPDNFDDDTEDSRKKSRDYFDDDTEDSRKKGRETQNKIDPQCHQPGPNAPAHYVTTSPDGDLASGRQKFEETLRMQRDTRYTTQKPETADAMIKIDTESEKKQIGIMQSIQNVLTSKSARK